MKSKSMVWRTLLLLFIAFLWGGGIGAYAEKKAWAKYDSSTSSLTFYYGEKGDLGDNEFALNNGEASPGWSDNALSITNVAFDKSFADARPTSCHYWFCGFQNLKTIESMEYLNTSEVTMMSYMFAGCELLSSLDLSHFDTKNVKNMGYMFYQCKSLESLDLKNFDTQNVTNMGSMFNGCEKITSLDLLNFNTSKVETMGRMFSSCTNLVTLDLTSFSTYRVTNSRGMFYNDSKLKTVYASDNFSLSAVTLESSYRDMFAGCVSLEGERKFADNGNTGKVFARSNDGYFLDKTMYRPWAEYGDGTLTFYYGYKRNIYTGQYKLYTSGQQWKPGWISDHATEIKKVVFDKSFAEARPTYCYGWFSGCENLMEIVGFMYLNTSEVYDMGSMFEGCTSLTSLDLSHFDTQKVTEMSKMFYSCSNLAAIYASDKFVLSAVTSDADMFAGCEKLKGDIAFDASSVDKTYAKNKNGYFLNGGSLRPWAKYDGGVLTFYYGYKPELGTDEYEMNTGSNRPKWIDNHKADITKVVFDKSFADARPTTCYRWFYDCDNLATIEGLEYLNTSEVKSMSWMFAFCSSLTTLDLSHFDTQKVTDMSYMFWTCTSLTALDLSHFDIQNVTDMSYMFNSCNALTSLDLSNFNTSNVTNMGEMFTSCHLLTFLNLSNFDTSKVTNMFQMFYLCESLTSLDISNFDTQNVSDMSQMFCYCKNLQTIYASESFVVKEDANCNDMFYHCNNLYGDIAFDEDRTDKTYAKLEGGYFTHKEYTRPWVKYADGTLTFSYGYKKELNDYQDEYPVEFSNTYPAWVYAHTSYYGNADDITKAVFDKSFAHYLPTKTENWFYNCKTMESVEGLENLNTSKLTSMSNMFAECSALETIDLSSFNTQKVSSLYGMFSGCSSLKSLDLKNFNTSNVEQMGMMFYNCSNLTDLNVSSFDTQKVTDMGSMFSGCSSLKTIDLKNFDTKAVTSMGYMFWRCSNLTDLDVSGFDTQQVGDMGGMFSGCSGLKTLDVSKFVTKQVYNMDEMFKDCSSLENLDLLNFNPEDLGGIKEMFSGCSKLKTLDLSKLKVDRVYETSKMFKDCASLTTLTLPNFENANMSATDEMFAGCSSLTVLDLSYLNTENAYNLSQMFAGCSNLTTIYASSLFEISEYAETTDMFAGCEKLKGDIAFDANYTDKTYAKISNGYLLVSPDAKPWVGLVDGTLTFRFGPKKSLGENEFWLNNGKEEPGWHELRKNITRVVISKSFAQARPTTCYKWFAGSTISAIDGLEWLNTSEVTDMQNMFWGLSLNYLDLSNFDTSKVTDMFCMFSYCSSLTSLNLSNFDTSKVTNMCGMFQDCSSLTSLNMSNFDTSKVTNMGGMFQNCSSLASLDLSKFDTSKVTDMSFMFSYCSSLTSLDLSKFDTSKVTDMQQMFGSCSSLTSLNLSNFDTSKVTNMMSMFSDCSSLNSLDLSNFDTSKVMNMIGMFGSCSSLTSLDLSDFDTSKVTNMRSMFSDCSSLTSLDLSYFDTSNVTSTEYMFYLCSKLSTIFASEAFDVSNVKESDYMFRECESLKGDISYDEWNVDKTYATTHDGYLTASPNVRPWVKYADGTLTFKYGKKEELGDNEYWLNEEWGSPEWISNQITNVVFDKSFAVARPASCYKWFYNLTSLTNIDGIEYLNTSNVTDMGAMFYGCSALTSFDLSKFDTSKVTDMSYMFYGCSKLNAIYWADKFDAAQLSSIDNSDMFYQCPATLYCSPKQYESFKSNSVIASAGNAVKPYVGINQKSEYGTLCVPVGSSLAEGSFTGFNKLYQIKDADKDKGTITLVESKSIEPGVPYVYHRYLEGVDFESNTEESSESTSQAKAPVMSVITFDVDENASAAVTAPKNEGSLLKGTFESMLAIGGSYILQTDGNFHPVAAYNRTLKVGAYRAYLDLSSVGEGGAEIGAKAYQMVFEDGEATGIDRINGEGSDKGVYDQADKQPKVYFDLMGRKVNAPQKGEIYIVNGKKVVYNK